MGSGGISILTNGNYVVGSPFWDSGSAYSQDGVGAVTWCSQLTGCNGTVSASNSLIGGKNGDMIGYGGVTALTNGNYVVSSLNWVDNGNVFYAGAVTWGNGMGGTTGVVSAANSLVGSTANDRVGDDEVIALTNGNYLVLNSAWDNGSVVNAGAVTWGNGKGGTTGVVSASNSLVGRTENDKVGDDFWDKVIERTNGNYVVISPSWDLDETHPDAGATGAAVQRGSRDRSRFPTAWWIPARALRWAPDTGTTVRDRVDQRQLRRDSPCWSPDGTASAWGAVTWGSGTAGVAGEIRLNSLVGSHCRR